MKQKPVQWLVLPFAIMKNEHSFTPAGVNTKYGPYILDEVGEGGVIAFYRKYDKNRSYNDTV